MTRTRRRLFWLSAAALPLFVLVVYLSACNKTSKTVDGTGIDANLGPVVPPGPPMLDDVTKASGIDFSYRTGEKANYYTILDSLGGGGALIDYDGDGLLDIFIPGGGYFDEGNKAYQPKQMKAFLKETETNQKA